MTHSTSSRANIRSHFRWLLLVGWLAAALGTCGPWVSHSTAALSLSGADLGEFVKFLPQVQDGSLPVQRQVFYLPAVAIVAGIALLAGSAQLRYPGFLRVLALLLALLISLHLLPPAWSPASLSTGEFRLQAIALLVCWLLLAGFWLLARLPLWLSGSFAAALALLSSVLTAWQTRLIMPAINSIYGTPSSLGWGFYVSHAGLLVAAAASAYTARVWARGRFRSRNERRPDLHGGGHNGGGQNLGSPCMGES